MSTGVIIALIVIVAAVVVIAAVLTLRARGPLGGRDLKKRFGPEYDRVVARHDGDAQAAERELTERVERHGGLREQPLEPAAREQYTARWAAAQEHFVDSPREALAETDRLLAELAGVRGFPDGEHFEEQFAALTVHHADHADGYRRVHRAAHAGPDGDGRVGTEEMREALVEARALFDELVGAAAARGHDSRTERRADEGRTDRRADEGRTDRPVDEEPRKRTLSKQQLKSAFNREHLKRS